MLKKNCDKNIARTIELAQEMIELAQKGYEQQVRCAGRREDSKVQDVRERGAEQPLTRSVERHQPVNRHLHAGMSPVEVTSAVDADGFNVNRHFVNRAMVENSHANGLPVSVYTVNWTWRMKRLLDLGIDAIFTDRPDRMLRLLRRHPDRWRRDRALVAPGSATPDSKP